MHSPDHQPLTPTLSHPERRRFARHSAQVQIELRQDGNDVPMRIDTTDLSRGGCYVELMMTIPVGTYVNATLWLDNNPIHIRGRVVTRHPQFGNGIMFLEFEGNAEKVLTQYLDAITV